VVEVGEQGLGRKGERRGGIQGEREERKEDKERSKKNHYGEGVSSEYVAWMKRVPSTEFEWNGFRSEMNFRCTVC